ncbi:ferredoxin [Sulfuricella denitrificans skB26]|uniref:Ferredoxin n=1 Tax=Sulfuricella denitrificans (strain DSM 22764 / NBRC 105220 / skB26) TaxID=1163617 RepID=S6AI49_SULDS|nr:2Fe-2S iron-sulfur cluster-binding protein [Sulfuricella denitrificans]BAN35871.1 ferredoxin [Sulfuricella denitrificans skB26]
MPQLLNLSRAARLVGVTRVALQKKIKDGVLASFDGTVAAEDLLRVYPDVQFEDNTAFERVAQIKEKAFGKRVFERTLPDKEVLAARLTGLSKELAETKVSLSQYQAIVDGLEKQLREWGNGGEEVQAAAASLRMWVHQELAARDAQAGLPNLTIRDSFLRVMAAHVKIQPSGHEFFVEGADTLLEAALRAGLALNYGCSNGNCGQCKARVVSGQVMKVRPHDYVLSAADKASGCALMCSNTAVTDVVIEAGEAHLASDIPLQHITAHVKSIEQAGDDMLILNLQTPRNNRLRFLAGQNATLQLGHALSAEFPVASCPCDDRNLQFHIRNLRGNPFADYVATRLTEGEAVAVEGPKGSFVLHEDSTRPLIFIAFGAGFAPVKSLMEHAMALDVAESVHLYWVVSREVNLYFSNLPRAWADALDNFQYTPLVAGTDLETAVGRQESLVGGLLQRIVDDYLVLGGFDVHVAGPESLVDAARKWLLGHGLPDAQLITGVVR